MNIFSLIVVIGVLFTLVIGQKSNQKSRTPLITLRNVEQESESPSVASTTTIYLESSHDQVPGDECNCTPFNLCKSYESTEDGGGLINIRYVFGTTVFWYFFFFSRPSNFFNFPFLIICLEFIMNACSANVSCDFIAVVRTIIIENQFKFNSCRICRF